MGITPDLTTLGKIIGGGFAVGAVAGRADILDLSSPRARRCASRMPERSTATR